CLGGHPGVEDVVVLAREDPPGERRLVAYVVGAEVEPEALRGYLQGKLPPYMVPSAFVVLEALPLTPNGKVDRKALPAPEWGGAEGFISPRDPLELQLAQIWENVLDVHSIGVKNNFFEVGGQSLLAIRLMAQIHHTFGKNLPLATLFEAPTIEQLAGILRRQTDSLRWSPLVAIQPKGPSRPFFCMPGAGGHVIYFHALARRLGLDQPFYGLQARGLDGESAPHTRVEDIAAYNIDALQVIQPQGPYLLGGHSFGAWVAFEMAQQLRKRGHEVARLFSLDGIAVAFIDKPATLDDASLMADIPYILGHLFGKNLEVSDDALRLLDPDEQLNYLKECLQMAEVWPPEIGTKQVRGLVQVFKANHQIHYVPQEVFPTRITLFRSSEVNPEDDIGNDQISEVLRDAALGWGQ
ncbi:MAG TPA: alpha/beta fold hydrolase, partial [Dehalococcoidia bacterium]|nr:alpha/beta fold hydrolase [Dehalococcoidia bacterium]